MSDYIFSVIERPNLPVRRGEPLSAISQAVLDTIGNGRAVRVELNGRTYQAATQKFRSLAFRRGLIARTRLDGKTSVIVWMEKKTDA